MHSFIVNCNIFVVKTEELAKSFSIYSVGFNNPNMATLIQIVYFMCYVNNKLFYYFIYFIVINDIFEPVFLMLECFYSLAACP